MRLVSIDPNTRQKFSGLPLPDTDRLRGESPTKTAALVDADNEVQAVGCLWLDAPAGPDGASSAFVGHLAAKSIDLSTQLLTALAKEAAAAGKQRILAPIDGSTWRSYRIVVESSGRAPFFLEPQTPEGWEAHFLAAGFTRAETYASIELNDLAPFACDDDPYKAQVAAAGIVMRDFNMQNFDADLVKLHALSLSAFAANPYYAPLGFEEFTSMYRPAVFLFEPGLALIAERNGEALGFIFAYRDGATKECAVLKTIAVSPRTRDTGLASHLTRRVLHSAAELGCASAIFALMHERNKSFAWAAQRGHVFRRYALMGKDL